MFYMILHGKNRSFWTFWTTGPKGWLNKVKVPTNVKGETTAYFLFFFLLGLSQKVDIYLQANKITPKQTNN